MSDDRTGRELTPRTDADGVVPREHGGSSPERFSAGERAHQVGLTEERAARIVRQSGNARNISFLALLLIVLAIPLLWFVELGFPVVGPAGGRQAAEANAQYVTDISRGYEIYLANCAQCHGNEGKGGVGPPLNDQAKLYNALTADGLAGNGHLNPDYLRTVLREGGRIVCGDPNSLMPAWEQPKGPLNYRQIEELIVFITAPNDRTFQFQPDHAEAGETLPPPEEVTPWRDPNYQPPPDASPVPACWRDPDGIQIGTNPSAAAPSAAPIESPGTAENPRVIQLDETADLRIAQPGGGETVTTIPVKQGETIRFEITNSANFPHNFYIGTQEQLEANARDELEGVPDFNSGTQPFEYTFEGDAAGLQFACIVPGHYGPMHGTFQVVP